MKIAITGTTGRLGGSLAEEYSKNPELDVTALDRRAMDFEDPDSVRECLESLDFDVLVNPAALTSVDVSEEQPDRALAINARAPEIMAEVSRARGARLIHISTDYVFDGESAGLRRETEPARPLNAYGRSKLEGEQRVHAVSPEFLVIRTSWIFGPAGPSFLDSILDRARTGEGVGAIADKFSSPTSSLDFCKLLLPLLQGPHAVGGTLHLSNTGSCSWQEYGQVAIDAALDLGFSMATEKLASISVQDMPGFVGSRPIHTAMSVDQFSALTGIQPRPWEEAVREHVEQIVAPRWTAKNVR